MIALLLALAGPAWTYQIAQEGEVLAVVATFPPGSGSALGVEEDAAPFLREVSGAAGEPRDGSWEIPACAKGCTVRYRFALGEAARKLHTADLAVRLGSLLEAPPASFLLHPLAQRGDELLRVQVSGPFATGLSEVEPRTWQLRARDLRLAPYSVFGGPAPRKLAVGAQTLQVVFAGEPGLAEEKVAGWARASAAAVAGYFGRLPVDGTLIVLVPGGARENHGRTLGGGGASILFWLAAEPTAERLRDDWVLVHELVHTGFPSLPRAQHWAEEGLATYLEPIARVRAGSLPAETLWRELMHGLPKGEPGLFDGGLDGTSNWGRTYWGGALFWLVADVRIREKTQGRKSLEDALRAVLAAGGNIGSRWQLPRALAVGDQAVGVAVLEPLYRELGSGSRRIDLPALLSRLGVAERNGQVVFDDDAPLAWARRGIAGSAAAAK